MVAAPPATTGADPAVWEGVIAVTGVPSASGVTFARGAISRSAARRKPKATYSRDWNRRSAVVEHVEELDADDPRVPLGLPDGAGVVWARLRFLDTTDGRAGLAAARDAAPGAWNLGFMRARTDGLPGAQVIRELDWMNLWPSSVVDTEVKSLASPAGSRLQVKSGAPAGQRAALRGRPGVPVVSPCSVCRMPAAGIVGGGLRTGEALVCASCVEAMTGALDERVATLGPDELAAAEAIGMAPELTPEEEYDRALADEQDWSMLPDGSLVEADQDPQRDGLAWNASARRVAGRR